MDLQRMTIARAAAAMAKGELSSRELVTAYLNAVADKDVKVNAFLKTDAEKLLALADATDARRKAGNALSEWDGIPIGIKDCIVVEGETCSCASKLLENVVSPYDSTAVARLKKLGFIPFGRLNMDEFAMGSSCENSAFKKTANPWDITRVPGGSSGGSAAAVAARMVTAAFRYFARQGNGHIAVISSIAGTKGLGAAPAYSATKRFQNTYLDALEQLACMQHLSIRFTDIRPGFVATGLLNDGKHYPMLMNTAYVARKIVSALHHRRRIAVIDWRYRIMVFFWKLIPPFVCTGSWSSSGN